MMTQVPRNACAILPLVVGLFVLVGALGAAERTDALGDPLPAGAVARLGTARLRQESRGSFVFSPDGQRIYAWPVEGLGTIWNVKSGAAIRVLPSKKVYVCTARFDDDSKSLRVVTTDQFSGNLTLWSLADDALKAAWTVSNPEAREKGRGVFKLAVFSGDGKFVVTYSLFEGVHRLQYWKVANGELDGEIDLRDMERLRAIVASPDWRWIACLGQQTVALADYRDRSFSILYTAEKGLTSIAAFTRDSKLVVSATSSENIRLWSLPSLEQIGEMEGLPTGSSGVAVAPDGTIAYGGGLDGKIDFWHAKRGKPVGVPITVGFWIKEIQFSPTGDVVAVVAESQKQTKFLFYDRATGRPLHDFPRHERSILAVAYSPDSATVTTMSYDKTAAYWDALSGKRLRTIGEPGWGNEYTKDLMCSLSRDGNVLAIDQLYGSPPQLWDAVKGTRLREMAEFPGTVIAISLSPDAKRLASVTLRRGEDANPYATVTIVDTTNGDKLLELAKLSRGIDGLAFSPDGKWICVSASGWVNGLKEGPETTVWHDASSGKQLGKLPGNRPVFSLDGRRMATIDQERGHVWDRDTQKELFHVDKISAAAPSATGKFLAVFVASTGMLRIYDIASQKVVWEKDTGATPNCLAFAPNGRTITTGFLDGTALVWELPAAAHDPQ